MTANSWLTNNRFAYVSVSRAQHDAQIYTNDGSKLSPSLRRESSQRTAAEVEQRPAAPKTDQFPCEECGTPKRSKAIVLE
jgi:hypothetical protein